MVNFTRGPSREVSSNVQEFEILDVGSNRFIVAFLDSQNHVNVAGGHVTPSGPGAGVHLDTQTIAVHEPNSRNLASIKKLGSIAGLPNIQTSNSFIVSVIDEHDDPRTFTFQFTDKAILQPSFVNDIAFHLSGSYIN
jgi:hypothetical protein